MPNPPRNRSLQVEQVGDVTVVRFVRSELLEDETIELLGGQLYALVDHLGSRKLVLNLAPVKRMASLMLGKIMTLHKKLKPAGGRLVLCGIDPEIRRIFDTLRLPQFLLICKDEQEALQSFG
jgi:anti-sigma B factor antagonist